jgi:molecular chaperone HscB
MTHFELLELPRGFQIDAALLDTRYRALLARVHPDRFADKTPADRRAAMQWSTQAGEAYQTLKKPVTRAAYLLSLEDIDVGAENNTAMEPVFLMQQMEWREAVEDAAHARNAQALEAVNAEISSARREREARLAALIDARAWQPAAEAVRQLMFLEKVSSEIGDKLAALDF